MIQANVRITNHEITHQSSGEQRFYTFLWSSIPAGKHALKVSKIALELDIQPCYSSVILLAFNLLAGIRDLESKMLLKVSKITLV